jgi:peptide-methionine (S)-S-oxide reductase
MKKTLLLMLLFSAVKAYAGTELNKGDDMETAILGGGCFWCTEAIYDSVAGIEKAESGYAGGKIPSPTYEDVSTGDSGHAEVVRITFDPKVITYPEILRIFFHLHDPTTLNQQGADRGTQYRSVIFYMNDKQKKEAEEAIKKITEEKLWPNPIVTEITPFKEFFMAEDYHQNYYKNNQDRPYCSLVIGPKIQKLKKEFADKLKK